MNSYELVQPVEIKEEIKSAPDCTIADYFADHLQKIFPVAEASQDIIALDHDYIKRSVAQLFEEINKENAENYGRAKRNSRRKPLICERCKKEFLLPINFKIHLETHEDCDEPEPDHSSLQDADDLTPEEDDSDVDVVSVFDEVSASGKNKDVHKLCSSGTAIRNDERVVTIENDEKHVKKVVKPLRYQTTCSVCQKILHKNSLPIHMKIHTGVKSFACYICQRPFTQKWSLFRHMVVHASDKAQKNFSPCKICGKHFPTICIDIHTKLHQTLSEQVSCEICGMTFSSKPNLRSHVRLHMDEKRYQCGFCGKKYLFKSCLRQHIKFHIGVKDKKCDVCGKKFINLSMLRRHRKSHFPQDNKGIQKRLKCTLCHRVFRFPNEVERHLKMKHDKSMRT